jgi:hypothetical protein
MNPGGKNGWARSGLFWAISLGLHGVLLFSPLPSKPPKPTEPRLVKITRLPSPTPRPTSAPSPTPVPTPSPTPTPLPSPTSSPSPVASPSPQVSPTPSRSTPEATPSPSPKPSPPDPPAAPQVQAALTTAIGQVTQNYGDRASDLSGIFAASPETFIEQPRKFYTPAGKPLPGFDGKTLQVDKATPAQVFSVYESALKGTGFLLTSLPDYGGGLLYEVKQGTVSYYLNLLPLTDKSGTLVVIWATRPGTGAN